MAQYSIQFNLKRKKHHLHSTCENITRRWGTANSDEKNPSMETRFPQSQPRSLLERYGLENLMVTGGIEEKRARGARD